MSPTPIATMQATVSASPLLAQFGTVVDRESAREMLAIKMNAAAAAEAQLDARKAATQQAKIAATTQADYDRAVRAMEQASERKAKPKTTTRTTTRRADSPIGDILGSRTGQTVVREVLRGIFSTLKRR